MRSEQTQPSQELRCQPWRERTIEEGNEETKIDLTYSATNGISRTGPPLGMPILRIIQVVHLNSELIDYSPVKLQSKSLSCAGGHKMFALSSRSGTWESQF